MSRNILIYVLVIIFFFTEHTLVYKNRHNLKNVLLIWFVKISTKLRSRYHTVLNVSGSLSYSSVPSPDINLLKRSGLLFHRLPYICYLFHCICMMKSSLFIPCSSWWSDIKLWREYIMAWELSVGSRCLHEVLGGQCQAQLHVFHMTDGIRSFAIPIGTFLDWLCFSWVQVE